MCALDFQWTLSFSGLLVAPQFIDKRGNAIRRQLQASRRKPADMQQMAGLVLLAEGVFQMAQTLACLALLVGPVTSLGADIADALANMAPHGSKKDPLLALSLTDTLSSPLRKSGACSIGIVCMLACSIPAPSPFPPPCLPRDFCAYECVRAHMYTLLPPSSNVAPRVLSHPCPLANRVSGCPRVSSRVPYALHSLTIPRPTSMFPSLPVLAPRYPPHPHTPRVPACTVGPDSLSDRAGAGSLDRAASSGATPGQAATGSSRSAASALELLLANAFLFDVGLVDRQGRYTCGLVFQVGHATCHPFSLLLLGGVSDPLPPATLFRCC